MAQGGARWGMAYNPYYEAPRRRFATTPTELAHIAAAFAALTAVLVLVFQRNTSFEKIHQQGLPFETLVAALISLLGFVLHELGHKFTAQHFGHWSEFRANWAMLGVALLVAYYLAIPFAAPGATWHTASGRRDQGKISAMGPLVNILIAAGALLLTLQAGSLDTVAGQLGAIVVVFSAFLALFNLVPLGPLDGRKILAWNPFVYVAMVALAVVLFLQGLRFKVFD